MKRFDTLADLAAASLTEGQYVETYNQVGTDGLGSRFYIEPSSYVPDLIKGDIVLSNGNHARFCFGISRELSFDSDSVIDTNTDNTLTQTLSNINNTLNSLQSSINANSALLNIVNNRPLVPSIVTAYKTVDQTINTNNVDTLVTFDSVQDPFIPASFTNSRFVVIGSTNYKIRLTAFMQLDSFGGFTEGYFEFFKDGNPLVNPVKKLVDRRELAKVETYFLQTPILDISQGDYFELIANLNDQPNDIKSGSFFTIEIWSDYS